MSNNDFSYYTIQGKGNAEFKDRGSKFFGFCFPIISIDEFKVELKNLKEAHTKAVHFCSAYRIGVDRNTFRASDDGEPSGSAGRPILGQIDSHVLTNVAIIVVRYFGGTLLGVPGLINAYKTSAALALQSVEIIQKPVLERLKIQFNYTQMNDIMMIIKQFDCLIENQEMQLFCSLQVGVPKNNIQAVRNELDELRDVEVNEV